MYLLLCRPPAITGLAKRVGHGLREFPRSLRDIWRNKWRGGDWGAFPLSLSPPKLLARTRHLSEPQSIWGICSPSKSKRVNFLNKPPPPPNLLVEKGGERGTRAKMAGKRAKMAETAAALEEKEGKYGQATERAPSPQLPPHLFY